MTPLIRNILTRPGTPPDPIRADAVGAAVSVLPSTPVREPGFLSRHLGDGGSLLDPLRLKGPLPPLLGRDFVGSGQDAVATVGASILRGGIEEELAQKLGPHRGQHEARVGEIDLMRVMAEREALAVGTQVLDGTRLVDREMNHRISRSESVESRVGAADGEERAAPDAMREPVHQVVLWIRRPDL